MYKTWDFWWVNLSYVYQLYFYWYKKLNFRVQYLDKHIKSSMLSNQDQDWIPLVTYRNSLLQGADDDNIKAPAPPKVVEILLWFCWQNISSQKYFHLKGRRGRKKKGLTDTDNDNNVQATRPMTPQRSEQTNVETPGFSPQQLFQNEDFLQRPSSQVFYFYF